MSAPTCQSCGNDIEADGDLLECPHCGAPIPDEGDEPAYVPPVYTDEMRAKAAEEDRKLTRDTLDKADPQTREEAIEITGNGLNARAALEWMDERYGSES